MPNYYNLNKAAKSINKDYQYMERHTPAMNQPLVEKNQEFDYNPGQAVLDAVYDAEKRFDNKNRQYANIFLWKDTKDSWMKVKKYQDLADRTTGELDDYSARYTNHSARKRASSSEDAKKYYTKYNTQMQRLSVMAEELGALDNVNSPRSIKEVKKFFKESMEALDLRETAMKAAAEVKSTSEADENFRKAKITRMILAQKLKLAQKYLDKYTESRDTRELGAFFQEQRNKLQVKLVLYLDDYKKAYLAARGGADRLKLEEIAPAENVQAENVQAENAQAENAQAQNAQAENVQAQNAQAENVQAENAQVENAPAENVQAVNAPAHIDVRNDTTPAEARSGAIKNQFGTARTANWKNNLRNGQYHVCNNIKLRSVRDALEEISRDQNDIYANQLGKIRNLAQPNTVKTVFKKHSQKGHSYSKNNETVFRFDLLGTGGSVDLEGESFNTKVGNFINSLPVARPTKDMLEEQKGYFTWLKEVKHHASVANFDPNNKAEYTRQFRQQQKQIVDQDIELVKDYFSYKKLGKKNEDQSLARVNRGIRVREAERGAAEDKRTLREGQTRELITIQGCEKTLGGGEFSIEASAEYMKELAKNRLTPIFTKWANGTEEPKTIHFMMDGVSRGGVNASLGAMSINGWVAKEYPQYLKFVKYDVIQRDPVPGPSTATAKDSIRIGGAARDQELDANGFIKGTNYKPLSKSATNSTVFYSLHPNVDYSSFFQPQRVYGANRIILSPFEHADDGKIPGVFNDLFKTSGKSREMLNNSNGELYAGSGVSDLDDGVYILDEFSTLTKINSYQDAVSILSKTRNDMVYSRRKGRILEVVKDWFFEHGEAQGGNVVNG